MTQERIEILNQLGFVFATSRTNIRSNSSELAWQRMYNKLVEYHKIHGHTNVPSTTATLGQWCVRQRYLYRLKGEKRLSVDRIKQLNALGFKFKTRYQALWDQRIQDLQQFKKLHGHCMVPRNYEPNKQLSFWVATQRKYYNLKMKGKPSYLTDERQKQLDDMDFVWSYWDYNFEQKGF